MIAFFAVLPAHAAPDESPRAADAPVDPVVERALRANAEKDWARAQGILRDALLKDPRNADYHNLYAYAIRKGEKPNLDLVFKHYNEALRIDPKHSGAHEYCRRGVLDGRQRRQGEGAPLGARPDLLLRAATSMRCSRKRSPSSKRRASNSPV
jgi:tetratricopeptide (TPR) repeat protein